MANAEMTRQIAEGHGFIAALDQSGGSTPKALKQYGVAETAWSDETGMFDLIHAMRVRIIKSPAFTGDKVVGAILFEQTMDREVDGIPTATYLWQNRHVVPFLKIDKGLEAEADGCQLMKPMPGLDALPAGRQVMLKLSLPTVDNFYAPLVDHPKVLKVVALSGGHSRAAANAILARNRGMIASFSRALTEGLSAQQTDAEFDALLADAIGSIHAASVAG